MNAQKMIDKSLIKQVNLAQSGFFESVIYGRYTQWLGDFELPDSCEVKSVWHEGREALFRGGGRFKGRIGSHPAD